MNEDEDDEKRAAEEGDDSRTPGDEAPDADGGAAESEEGAGEVVIRPYEGKVGEAGGNLRARGGWFRRRTGGGK